MLNFDTEKSICDSDFIILSMIMYNNLNNAAANLDKLMVDLKANPKRYVSFSVFGGMKD